MLGVWKQQSEERGPKQQAGDQLAHDRRLAQPHHGFAQHPADKHENDNLANEDCFGWTLSAFGGESGSRRDRGESQEPKPIAM